MAAKKAMAAGKNARKRPPKVKKPVRAKPVKKMTVKSPGKKTVAKGKPVGKPQSKKSPLKKKVVSKATGKSPLKSPARGRPAKKIVSSPKKPALKVKKMTKSPIKVSVGPKGLGRGLKMLTAKPVAKSPARPPGRPAKAPHSPPKPTAKSSASSLARSSKPVAKSPTKAAAKSPVRSVGKMEMPTSKFYQKIVSKFPVRPAARTDSPSPRRLTDKSPVKPKTAAVTRSPVKARSKAAVLSGPARRVQIKASPSIQPKKLPVKPKSPAARYSVKIVKKSPGKTPVQAVASTKRGSPVKKLNMPDPVSSPKKVRMGSPARGSPQKTSSSSTQRSPQTVRSPRKETKPVLTRSPRRITVVESSLAKQKTPTRGGPTGVKQWLVKPRTGTPGKGRGGKEADTGTRSRSGASSPSTDQHPERLSRKRSAESPGVSPTKKSKSDEKSDKGGRPQRSEGTSPEQQNLPRPSRVISKPARYLDDEPEQKSKPKPVSPTAQKLKTPPRPTRVTRTLDARKDQTPKGKGTGAEEESRKAHPCKFCGLVYRTEKDVVMHQNRCDKNTSTSKDKAQSNVNVPGKPQEIQLKSPMVLNIPSGKNINEVITQAIRAATNAGLVAPNKQVIVRGPTIKDTKVITKATVGQPQAKPQTKPAAASSSSSPKRPVPKSVATPTKIVESTPARTTRPGSRVAVVSPEPKKPVIHTPSVKEMLAKDKSDVEPKFFTCLDCGSCFPSRKEVSEHKRSCSGVGKSMVNACMDCNATFQTRAELNTHRKENHNSTRPARKSSTITVRGYRCSVCNVFYPDSQELKNHIEEIHGGQANGSMCNVVATPESLPPGNWNKSISEEMVEEVIKTIVNGVSSRIQTDGDAPSTSSSAPVQSTSQQRVSQEASSSPQPASSDSSPSTAAPYRDARTPGQCLDCFMKVNSRLELAKHKRQCKIALQNKQMFCFECGSPYKSYKELAAHKQAAHSPLIQTLKCSPCDITFKSNTEWQEHHQQVHGGHTQAKTLKRKRVSFAPEETESGMINDKSLEGKKSPDGTPTDLATDTLPTDSVDEVFGASRQAVSYSPRSKPVNKQQKAIGTIQYITPEVVSPEVVPKKKKKEPPKSSKPSAKDEAGLVQVSPTVSENKADTPASISLANGLVTISADKANDYQIFVDAKQDGSSIQVKLVRNDSVSKEKEVPADVALSSKSGSTPESPVKSPPPVRRKSPRRSSPVSAPEKAKGTPTPAAAAKKTKGILKDTRPKRAVSAPVPAIESPQKEPQVKGAQASATSAPTKPVLKRSGQEKNCATGKASSTKGAPEKAANTAVVSTGGNPVPAQGKEDGKEKEKDQEIGMVVQKGKPFVIGGQTMVPIQFPPGYQLPGGNSGGQKVFAIPATNLPPGLLQLMGKQVKGGAPPQASTSSNKPSAEKPPAATASSSKKKPTLEIKAVAASRAAIPSPVTTSPLKGMTGAQLMARAQAKILGRPMRAHTASAPLPILAPKPAPASSKTKSTSPRAKQLVATSPKQVPVKQSQVKPTTTKQTPASKQTSTAKPTSPQAQLKKPQTDQLSSGYRDPLFVYQCTNCNQTFKSTGDIKLHMVNGCAGSERNQRSLRRRIEQEEGTGVWHIKPVAQDEEEDDVEWFVASNEEM